MVSNGARIVVGNGGSVLRSRDGGESCKVFNRADHSAWSGVTGNDRGELNLVGQGGVRLGSANGAALSQR